MNSVLRRYIMPETLNEMIRESVEKYSNLPALKIREGEMFKPISYREFGLIIEKLGAGLLDLGIKKGDHVGLVSDNRYEWLICDLAILGTGACDVPRGSDSTAREIEYILRHAEIRTAFVENKKQLDKVYAIGEELPGLKILIVISSEGKIKKDQYPSITVYLMDELIRKGEELLKIGDTHFRQASQGIKKDDLATIIYTSGTTGEPKGVMLSHGNIMHNVINAPKNVPITTGDRFLSILPAWHSFERTVEYVLLHVGASNAYSKPTAQVLLKDLELEKPHYIASVPRIWEALYNAIHYKVSKDSKARRFLFHFFINAGIRYSRAKLTLKRLMPHFTPVTFLKRVSNILSSVVSAVLLRPLVGIGDKLVYAKIREKTGGELKAGISGGGALQQHVDDFFAGVGLSVLEGYGLTETSPIVAVRTFKRPVPYTVGPLLKEVEVKIVDENGQELSRGKKGIILVKGPLVMLGYYKNEGATKNVLLPGGWLNTGDLGRLTLAGELQITGRAKDTIVLLGGENIEPLPIEQKLKESMFIQQVMVTGQDKKLLGALIVPDFEAIKEFADQEKISYSSIEELIENQQIKTLYRNEIKTYLSRKHGFRAVEYVSCFTLLPKEFEVGRELTHTLKMKRNLIADLYKSHIELMYNY
jgi:long-chain acyl-CoA synthetase